MTELTPEQHKEFSKWFYAAYEKINGFTSTGDPWAMQHRDSAFAWAWQGYVKATQLSQTKENT